MVNTTRDPELENAVARAMQRATSDGRSASVYDLFSSLLDAPDVQALLHEVGADPEALQSSLRSAGDLFAKRRRLTRWWTASRATLEAPIALAAQRTVSKSHIGAVDVLAAGFDIGNSNLRTLLERSGLSRRMVLRWLCGGRQPDNLDEPPEGDLLELVMLNDDYTPMVTVLRVLQTVLSFDGSRAFRSMRAVHDQGSSSIGRYEREEALRLARAATTMAEAEGAPLRVVLRRTDAASHERDGAVPATRTRTGRWRESLAALARRLTARPPFPDGVASSDGMITTCAVLALGVWLAWDRYGAGLTAEWTWMGLTGCTWYAAGLAALAWVLHRVARTPDFRSVLAALVGMVPLTLAMGLAISSFVPGRGTRYTAVLLAGVVLVTARRLMAPFGALRPGWAVVAGLGFVTAFTWATEQTYVSAHFWYANTEDDHADSWDQTERLLFEQPDRIDAAARQLRAGDPEKPSVFFVGFAGVGEQRVFAEEAKLAESVIAQRYGTAGRSLLLVNDQRDFESRPLATVRGLSRALGRVGQRMDRSKDVLFLVLTSHGSEGQLSVSNRTWPLEQLDAPTLRRALDDSGIRWRVIVISACHSGAFIPALADESTAVFTSAAADRVSFGCSDDRNITEFGAAFVRDALPRATSLEAAFEQAKAALAERERRQRLAPSMPQARVGAALSAHWQRIEAARGQAASGRAEPRGDDGSN